ncbi:MAG: THUMP domain-containing class I SAM-dependent RNA methyltransferase [Flavobacteriales bacterium]
MDNFPYIAVTTLQGLEGVLQNELTALGAENAEIQSRAVTVSYTPEMVYKINMFCRTGLRVLLPFHSFKAENNDQLYEEAKKIDWEKYLKPQGTFVFDFSGRSSHFTHLQFASLKIKDALCDLMRDKHGKRPSVDKMRPDARFVIHFHEDEVRISIDTSGQSLHIRNTRSQRNEAPMSEVLAAGMIRLSGWDPATPFADYMCGTGTLLMEAYAFATDMAPCLHRTEYAFMRFDDFNQELYYQFKTEARKRRKRLETRIFGGDIDAKSVQVTQTNLETMGALRDVEMVRGDFTKIKAPMKKGLLMMNPPYGLRIGDNVEELYQNIGSTLKNQFSGWTAWILSGNPEAMKQIGLKPSAKIPLLNGNIECKFAKFELFEGSLKEFKSIENE